MKIGIALGGGGARGFAHIGILRVLEEAGIKCDVISGTSIGALVGAVFATGNLDRLIRTAQTIKLTDIPILLSPTLSLAGMFSGKKTLELLADFIDVEKIEELPKPFAAIATDLEHSQIVTLTSGNLRNALRASISIPAVFTPVMENGQVLVDGGTLEPVPVQACRDLGADFVIAVDLFGAYPHTDPRLSVGAGFLDYVPSPVSSALSYLRELSAKITKGTEQKVRENDRTINIIEVVLRTLCVSQQHLTEARLREHPADIVIKPAVSSVSLLDFHRGSAIIEVGTTAGQNIVPLLLEKLEAKRNETER